MTGPQMLDFSALITDRTKYVIGREWEFAEIDRWLADPGASRFFVITGAPGSGKTTIAAKLTQLRDLAAYHFCLANQSNTLDPHTFCESLALQLANHYPEFAKSLAAINTSMRINVTSQIHESAGEIHGVVVRNLSVGTNPGELFDRTVRWPLVALVNELPHVSVVILVDGIDEAVNYPGEISIVDLLANAGDLPGQVRFVLTSRLGPHLARLPEAYHLSLDDRQAQTHADLQAYVQYVTSRIVGLPRSPADRLVERIWVWQGVEQWLAKGSPPHFLLSGPAGSGKSTLIRQLEQMDVAEHRDDLPPLTHAWAYFHACHAGDDTTLDPLRFLQGLAGGLAGRYPVYSEALTRIDPITQIKVDQKVETAQTGARVVGVSIGTLSIGELDARTAFEHVVRRPLEQLCTASFAETILITVDALDEAQGYANNALANLIGRFVQPEARWPAQVRWLLTSRPDPRIIHQFGQPALDLVANAPGNDDIYLYAHDRLDLLADPDRETLARRLADTAKGIFQYAHLALNDAVQEIKAGRPWNELELPAGLSDLYRKFLRRELGEGLTDWLQDYSPLLGSLSVAQGSGLTRRQLAGIMKKDPDSLKPLLTATGQYLEGVQSDGPFRTFHQSFRDFLQEDREFGIDLSEAHRKIAAYFIDAYNGEWKECQDQYALQYTPIHLVEAMRHLSPDADPLARRKLAAQMQELFGDAVFWQRRHSGGLALEGAYGAATLMAMLDIFSRYRQAKELLPLLGTLSIARARLTTEQLAHVTGLELASLREGLESLHPYLTGDDASGFALFHRSLAAYIENESQKEHQRLAEYYLRNYDRRWAECDSYGLGWLITHLVGGKLWQGLAATLADAGFWQARLEKTGLAAATEDLRSARELAPATGMVRESLGALLDTLRMCTPSSGEAPGLDIATMVQAILARVEDMGLDQPQSEVTTSSLPADLVARVVEKSEGNFLYVRLVLQELEREPSRAVTLMQDLPAGLEGFYRQELYRLMQGEGPDQWRRIYQPILGILAVVRESLTKKQLARLAGIRWSDLHEVLSRLASLLNAENQENDTRYRLYHGSFQEFLTDSQYGREFWMDPIHFHLQIADHYQKDYGWYWEKCDAYGLRNTITHFERAAQGSMQPERHNLVEQLVRVALDPDFQRAYEDRLHDPFGLDGDLALATAAAVHDEHPKAPLVLVPAALGWAAFRGRKLNPRMLFELAGQGQAPAALSYLNQYPVEPEWDLAARWIIAWLGVDVAPSLARELADRSIQESPPEDPLHVLGLRVRAALEGTSASISALPPAPGSEVAMALAGTGELQDESTTLLSFGNYEEVIYLADRDGPLLVAYAAAHPAEGTEYLRRYISLHDASSYSFYRRMSLWRVLDAVLRHPDPTWSRTMAAEVAGAALAESDVEFREGLDITILALQARAGKPGAAERLEERRQAALSEAQSSYGPVSGGDPWAHRLRRLAALAEGCALALGNPVAAAVLLEHARTLPLGYAGFKVPALIELASTMLSCGMKEVVVRPVLEEARFVSHNVADPTFCARSTARWNALTKDWRNNGRNLATTIGAFANNPAAPEFAALHYVGEPYEARKVVPTQLPLPDWLGQANTLRSLAVAFQLPLYSVRLLNPGRDPDAPLPEGTLVSMPDPEMAPQLAARLAALVLAETGLPGLEQTWLIQQLVPTAVSNPTALDAVLSRLLLAARIDDLGTLER